MMRTAVTLLLATITLGWVAAGENPKAEGRKAKAQEPPPAPKIVPPRTDSPRPKTEPPAPRPKAPSGKAAASAEDEFAARRLLKRAEDLLLARETERAVKMIESVIEQYPNSKAVFEAWLALGKHYVGAANYPAAINALRHLNALKKDAAASAPLAEGGEDLTGRDLDIYLEGLYLTGIAHFHTHQFAAAFPILRKITNSYPNTVWANQSYYYIGMCHFAQGNWNRAIEALSLVGTFVDPSSPAIEYAEAGRRFFVKVEDADLPVLFRLGKKPLVTLETKNGDKETLECIPLGGEAGIFIASIPTRVAQAKPGDGELQVIGGDTITAKYVDDNTQEGQKAVAREKKVRVVSTAVLRFTLGTFESNASGAFLGQPLHVLLHDVDMDTTPEADSVTVKLSSRYRRAGEGRPETESAARRTKSETEPLASALDVKGDDEEQYVIRDEVLLKLNELPPPADANAKPETQNAKREIHTGRFGGTVMIEPAREGQPIDKTDLLLTCAVGDEVVASYIDELHAGGEVPRPISAAIAVVGELDGRPRATQNIVPDPVLRAKKLLVEATAYLELARIFRSMGLAKGAKEKALEGLDRVESILREQVGDAAAAFAIPLPQGQGGRARSPIPPQLREEAYKLKWELHIVQDDFDNAIATCRLFNRLYPDSPFVDQALIGIATVRMERKEYTDAIAVYRQVLTLTTSQAKAEAQFRIAEATEAIAAKALAARPAGATKAPQQSEAAIQQYRICAEKFPDSEFAGRSLAKLVDYCVEQSDFARAEDLLEQVFQDYPDGSFLDSMLLKWVLVAYRRGDYAKAYDKCSQLIFEYPASEFAAKAKEILPKIEEKVKSKEKPAAEKEG